MDASFNSMAEEMHLYALNQANTARRLNGSIEHEITLPPIQRGEKVALVYDGTLEGLATLIFIAFAVHCAVEDVHNAQGGRPQQPRLSQRIVHIESDISAALRVRRTICRNCGQNIWDAIACASASDGPGVGFALFRFAKAMLAESDVNACARCSKRRSCTVPCGKPPRMRIVDRWSDPLVAPVLRANRRVANEVDKTKQFIRFQHTADDLWYARCNPACNTVPFVMHHFSRRFNTQRFVIYDENHGVAGLSEGGKWQLVRTDALPCPPLAAEEEQMQRAWQRFYKALSVNARHHPELRRGFMPVRLWKNLVELQQPGVGAL